MMWAFRIAGFCGTGMGKISMALAAIAAVVGLRAWDISHQRGVGAKNEQVRVETVGKKIDAAAQKKREKIERAPPSEVDNALRKYCRDCGP